MPWRFYRYMLVDVLRQFAITAVILVIVIAFGAAIKPLSSDSLLTGWDTMKYLFLAIIPMLQFALPFAGAFAATICLHRMTQDNEFIAMSVSGQSYVRLLAPMVVFGGTLTIIVAVLAQSVIPLYIGKMAEQMTSDLPRLLTNSIKQHTPFVQGNLVIWAEDIFLDSNSSTDDRMALDHVAVAKTDDKGEAKMYFTAAAAVVDVQNVDNQTSLYVRMRDTTQWTKNDEGGSLRGAREGHLTHPINLPSLTNQRLTALSRSKLLHLKDHPLEYHHVQRAATSLTIALTQEEFLSALEKKLKADGDITLIANSGGREFVVSSPAMDGTSFEPPIEVTTIQRTGETSNLSPERASLLLDYFENGEIETVTLEMRDVIVGAGKIGENQRAQLVVPSLQVKAVPFPTNNKDQTIAFLLNQAAASSSQKVMNTAANLRRHVSALDDHVAGRIGQRWAVSMLPILAILLGSLLALRNPDLMPLGVYARVFVPTVIAMLLIFSGGQMIRDAKEVTGFSVMWIGNLALAGLVIFHWLRLRVT